MNQAVSFPGATQLRHVAIIMDGNNRFARKNGLEKGEGHLAGKAQLDEVVQHAFRQGIPVLTVFAFSSENWNRPADEVALLMELLDEAIEDQIPRMIGNQVSMRFIGDRSRLSSATRERMEQAEARTAAFKGRHLNIAIGYGGHWDITQATRKMLDDIEQNRLDRSTVTESTLEQYTELGHFPPVDLLIRTGGEYRISNFLLWQLAYAELYFSPLLWPEFGPADFDQAVDFYYKRDRCFGKTREQLALETGASRVCSSQLTQEPD